ncbi:MAG: cysteine rich repeat-containing protein [Burkholderiales bacterium]|jgi:hypothetical protein|nr:cysteine rich repeat-containing protein [Burkholderiales bacterium]
MGLDRIRMLRIATAAIVCAGLVAAGGVSAQEPSCKADLAKFCPQAKPGGGQVVACLKQNSAQLSPSCQARVAQMKAILAEVHQACEEDIHFLCEGIQPGGGRIAACLKQSASEVSPGCKARLAEAKSGK